MRKGKISLDNVSGGMVTSSPLISTPSRFSRYLQNYYINAAGHIKKIPGYSPISNQVSNIKITTGIDFRKSDGTSIKLVGGLNGSNGALYKLVAGTLTGVKTDFASTAPIYLSQIGDLVVASNGSDLPVSYDGTTVGTISMPFDVKAVEFVGSGLNDITVQVTASTATTYEVEIDGVANPAPAITYSGSVGENDLSIPSVNYTGEAASANFDVEIDGTAPGTTEDGLSVEDNFTDGDISGWSVVDGIWSAASGELINGVSGAGGGGSISIPSTLVVGSWEWKAKITGTTHNDYILAYFMSNSSSLSGDGYLIKMMKITSLSQMWYEICRVTGGSVTTLGSYKPAWDSNYHTLRVTRTSSGLTKLFVDGVERISVTDNTHTSSTHFGFFSYPNPAGGYAGLNYIDDVVAWASTEVPGNRDTIKYNVNGGPYVTGEPLTSLREGLAIGPFKLMCANTVGHDSSDVYDIKVSSLGTPDKFQWRKNGGAWSAETDCKLYPYYTNLDSIFYVTFNATTGNELNDIYSFQVDGATTPDTIKWRKDAEEYTASVPVVAGSMLLKEGVNVRFKYFTGHVSGASADAWTFDVSRDTVKYRDVLGEWTTGQIITGAFQTIVTDVQFKFGSTSGHTLGDKWSIPVDQSVRFGKSYTYKNRLWLIGADGQTVYYSALLLPTDFVSESAGYLDFRYVIPQTDTLMDMSSLMNYIVFFFKNHIVVYAGTDPTAQGDFIIYQTINDMGLLAPGTVVSVGSDIYFLTNKGIKSLNQTLTAGALNVANLSEAIDTDIIAAIDSNTSGVYASAHYATLGLVMFLIGTKMFIYSYRQKAWSIMVIPSADDVSKILSMFQTADGFVLMGGYDYLFEFDPTPDTNNFNGVAPVYRWTSGMMKVTSADSIYFNELILRLMSADASTFTLKTKAIGYDTPYEDQAAFNQQTVDVPAITKNDVVMNFARAPLFGAGKFIQIDLTHTPTNADNNDVEITGAEIYGEMGQV